ncbi:hypothetical protein LIER_19714 [Lithospermum erythrorhizon]|uniref:Uncharacterized protein n=1 Tax=Lithospermum erythrorhizon TaxID=34254 RepID=A0AAV3QLV3_LITER
MDVPSAGSTEDVTAGKGDVTPSVADKSAGVVGLSEERAEPTTGDGVANTLNTEDVEFDEAASKEERAAKRARRVERKVKRATEEAVEDDVQEIAEEQRSDEEDIDAIIIKRRKVKGKLKIDENRSRVGNKRIPKNVAVVSTENVALNSEEEEAKWRFVASRRIAAERMLSEVTKKNAYIMGILEDAEVMPIVETVGPYFPKLVREFICSMIDDINEPESIHFQKVTLRNCTIDFSPSLINAYYGQANKGKTGAKLKLSEIAKVIEAQQPDILTVSDEEAPSPKFITISPKLLQGTHVVEIPLRAIETGSRPGAGNE